VSSPLPLRKKVVRAAVGILMTVLAVYFYYLHSNDPAWMVAVLGFATLAQKLFKDAELL
jgi:hypothetical protein